MQGPPCSYRYICVMDEIRRREKKTGAEASSSARRVRGEAEASRRKQQRTAASFTLRKQQSADRKRKTADRKTADRSRINTDGNRQTAERRNRQTAERSRQTADRNRQTAERSRQTEDRNRQTAERSRQAADGSRQTARRHTGAGFRTRSEAGSRQRAAGRNRKAARVLTKEQKQRALRRNLIIAGGVIVGVILWYCIVANSYKNRFLPHTYINGFDMGRMSAADAEAILKKSVETYSLELGFRGGGEEVLTSRDVDLTYVSSNEVEKILAEQNRAGWIRNFMGKRSTYNVSTSFHFDSDKLRSYLESLPEFHEANITKPQDARIVRKVNNTFQVATEVEGNEPNEDAIFEDVDKAINASEARLNLAACEGAYVEPGIRSDDEDLNYTVERFNSLVNCNITITTKDGSVEQYGRDDFVEWITYSEETGSWSVSKEALYTKCWNIMQAIADRDNDKKTVVEYDSKYCGKVVLPCATYGYVVDVEAETDKMYEALINRHDADIVISNSTTETMDPTGGGTYVEVDVTNQVVTYFRNGEVYMEMACVTGKEADAERRTPSGVFSVLDKVRDTVLGSLEAPDPGQRYESHVDVWMPFYESYGMHDASWRENFGGSWYYQYGSHGCVNLPPSEARALFDAIEIFTPVIVLREGDNAPEGTKRGDTTWNPPDGGIYYADDYN